MQAPAKLLKALRVAHDSKWYEQDDERKEVYDLLNFVVRDWHASREDKIDATDLGFHPTRILDQYKQFTEHVEEYEAKGEDLLRHLRNNTESQKRLIKKLAIMKMYMKQEGIKDE